MKRLTMFTSQGFVTILMGLFTSTMVTAATLPLLNAVTNPFPASGHAFGVTVAIVGADRLLVGAQFDQSGPSAAGAAFLFDTNGQRIITLTNPAAADPNEFGMSVAALGPDRVVIGAYQDSGDANWSGAVYLFNTNGTLLKRFAKPAPEPGDGFGAAVAAAGDRWLLIGAPGDSGMSGSAFLMNTNGIVIATLTNSTPEAGALFGYSVAALGVDRVIVGAPGTVDGALSSGAAYLFSTNGASLKRFANPNPHLGAGFGTSVAPLGTDGILVGAHSDDSSAADAGIAYLFETDGDLLTTFRNPEPEAIKGFGVSVVAVGTGRVAIGAFLSNGSGNAPPGKVYLFRADGILLAEVTSPIPAANDYFGYSLASIGSDKLLVGAAGVGIGGAAYLFDATPVGPALELRLNAQHAVVSWVADGASWVLQETHAPGNPMAWLDSNGDVVVTGNTNIIEINLDPNPAVHSFRLRDGP